MRSTLKDFELNEHLVPTDIIFSDYIRYWLKIATIRIDIVTIQGYEAAANAHILPYFDNLKVKLKDINHFILQEYFNVKYQSGKKDGQAVYLQRL